MIERVCDYEGRVEFRVPVHPRAVIRIQRRTDRILDQAEEAATCVLRLSGRLGAGAVSRSSGR